MYFPSVVGDVNVDPEQPVPPDPITQLDTSELLGLQEPLWKWIVFPVQPDKPEARGVTVSDSPIGFGSRSKVTVPVHDWQLPVVASHVWVEVQSFKNDQ